MSSLKPIGAGLWVVDDDNFIGMGAWFPVRMTLVRIGDGLWCHSPTPIDDALASEMNAIAPVRWIVKGNAFHGKWLAATQARWPDARVYEGGPRPAEWASELDAEEIAGCPKLAETAYLHRASRSLIVTDLFFNMHEAKTWLMPWILRMAGAWQKTAQSRVMRTQVKDKAAAGASIERILSWEFERAIPTHGRIVEEGARAALANALWWMRGGLRVLSAGGPDPS